MQEKTFTTEEAIKTAEDLLSNFVAKYYANDQEKIERFWTVEKKFGLNLKGFMAGTIFGNPYTEEEQQQIREDLAKHLATLLSTFSEEPTYTSSAGAPGTGKSYYLEETYGFPPKDKIYGDPDRVGLPILSRYQKEQATDQKQAYQKWRDASNFIANFLFVKAIAEKQNFLHGVTATSDRIISIYKALCEENYPIYIELINADEEDRKEALAKREQTTIQIDPKDAIAKVAPVYQRIADAYFLYATRVNIYFQPKNFFSGEKESKPVLAAVFKNDTNGKKTIEIVDKEAFNKFLDQGAQYQNGDTKWWDKLIEKLEIKVIPAVQSSITTMMLWTKLKPKEKRKGETQPFSSFTYSPST